MIEHINGIKVYHKKINIPITEMRVSFLAGARYDGDNPGIAHFAEHSLFCGTENRNNISINNEVESLGGYMNALTGRETVSYYFQCFSEHFTEISNILVDLINHSTFPYSKLKKEKSIVKTEIASRISDMETVGNYIDAHFFGPGFGHSITGTYEDIDKISRNDVIKFVKNNYSKENCAIGITGPINKYEILKLVNSINLPDKLNRIDDNKFISNKKSGLFKVGKFDKKKEINISMRWPSGPIGDNLNPAMDILCNILSDGSDSRLGSKLRMKAGISYGVNLVPLRYLDRGCVVLEDNFVNSNNMEKALGIIFKEIQKIKSKKVNDDEISIIKNKLTFGHREFNMSPLDINEEETLSLLYNTHSTQSYHERLTNVTKKDILEAANIIFNEDPLVYVYNN